MLGAGDIREEVVRASRAALYSGLWKSNNPDTRSKKTSSELPSVLPDFLDMLMIVIVKSNIQAMSSFHVVVGEVTL